MLPLPEWARLVLAALTCFRLSWLVINDGDQDGLLEKLRRKAGVYDYAANGQAKTYLGRWLGCPYCISVPIAALVSIPVLFNTRFGDFLLVWGGLAGAVAMMVRWRPWQR